MTKSLQNLEIQLKKELNLLEIPPSAWVEPPPPEVLNVAIVGAGMAGLTTAFALMREGVDKLMVFDESPKGIEGPWNTYARMLTLRSKKNLAGPSLGLPLLTFRAWYTAQYGEDEWENLYKIPTSMWMNYLIWYKNVLGIPVLNEHRVTCIYPEDNFIVLEINGSQKILAKKVVLATGRGGFGGCKTPKVFEELPKRYYAHTCEPIDFIQLRDKHVIIIGSGSSSFDSAAVALENNAKHVTMLTRSPVSNINKFASITYPGFSIGYYKLPDKAKLEIMEHAFETGSTTPPFESLERVQNYSNFELISEIKIEKVEVQNDSVIVKTDSTEYRGDFIILGTGFEIDGKKQNELLHFMDKICLWEDKLPNISNRFGAFPYLGEHYQFLEKSNEHKFLQNIYCFNYAATLSHGLTSGDIPDISRGATRLALGIVSDLFTQNWQFYYNKLQKYNAPEFLAKDYNFLRKVDSRH